MASPRSFVAALLTACWAATPAVSELLRVVVVARHGNREPNPQVPWVCPNAKHISEQFKEPLNTHMRASLSRAGKAENYESGNFLRQTYKKDLYGSMDAPWKDDGSFFALSERMNRNVVSMEALILGLFPEGTGEPQFLKSRPNLVPFLTSTPFHDTLINTPRDGPCKTRYLGDLQAWNKKNSKHVIEKNKETLTKFGQECGFDFIKSKEKIGEPFTWGIKAATDAFAMAKGEGIDVTDGGKFTQSSIDAAMDISHDVTNDSRFGQKHQITYWLGRFVEDALFANLKDPNGAQLTQWDVVGFKANAASPWQGSPDQFWNQLKMLVFLNHRELMMSLSFLFGYDALLATPLKAGSMIIYELHKENGEEFIITKAWNPSQPDWALKHEKLVNGGDLMELYDKGTVETLAPGACDKKERCTLKQLRDAYSKWTAETGTWQEVCDYPASAADNVKLEEWDDDESISPASDAAIQALAHAAESTSVIQESRSSTLSFILCALVVAIPVSFLAGMRFSVRRQRVTADEVLLG